MALNDFLDFLDGLGSSDSAATDYLSSPVGRGAVVRAGIEQGLSGAQILDAMSGAGFGMRRQDFYGLYGELSAMGQQGASIASAVASGAFDESMVADLEGGRPGTYMVNVRSVYQKRDDLGNWERGEHVTSILQRDGLDIAAALDDANELLSNIWPGDTELGQILGLEVSGVYQWQG